MAAELVATAVAADAAGAAVAAGKPSLKGYNRSWLAPKVNVTGELGFGLCFGI